MTIASPTIAPDISKVGRHAIPRAHPGGHRQRIVDAQHQQRPAREPPGAGPDTTAAPVRPRTRPLRMKPPMHIAAHISRKWRAKCQVGCPDQALVAIRFMSASLLSGCRCFGTAWLRYTESAALPIGPIASYGPGPWTWTVPVAKRRARVNVRPLRRCCLDPAVNPAWNLVGRPAKVAGVADPGGNAGGLLHVLSLVEDVCVPAGTGPR